MNLKEFEEGEKHRSQGYFRDQNPYLKGSKNHADWNRGWDSLLGTYSFESEPGRKPKKSPRLLIFSEFYSHENCDCYKILMPFSKYGETKMVLCKVSEGLEKAKVLAYEAILKRTMEVINSNDLNT